MRLSHLEPLLAIVSTTGLCFASPGSYPRDISIDAAGSQVPFNFTYLFTAHLSLGAPQGPIPIPGGVRIIEAILNGTVTGPAINATLGYSLATPSITNNGTIQRPIINAVGTTDDGLPLYLYETGLGSPNAQVTRIELEIGGGAKYAAIRDGYILASVQASADRRSVEVMGYLVQS